MSLKNPCLLCFIFDLVDAGSTFFRSFTLQLIASQRIGLFLVTTLRTQNLIFWALLLTVLRCLCLPMGNRDVAKRVGGYFPSILLHCIMAKNSKANKQTSNLLCIMWYYIEGDWGTYVSTRHNGALTSFKALQQGYPSSHGRPRHRIPLLRVSFYRNLSLSWILKNVLLLQFKTIHQNSCS